MKQNSNAPAETGQEKKKLTTAQKVGLGILGLAVTIGLGAYVCKKKGIKVTEVFKKKKTSCCGKQEKPMGFDNRRNDGGSYRNNNGTNKPRQQVEVKSSNNQ